MEKFKCRASGAGALMINPKLKSETISETTKTFLENWVKEGIYGIRPQINSKYIDKGLEFEDVAIDKTIEWLDLPLALKNKQRFTSYHFTGEPDLILNDCVIDIKNSWDAFTFPLFETEIPTKAYYYQLQIYMYLTGLKKAKLVYVLLNTPETYNSMEIDYSSVDKKFRIKVFEIEYNHEVIKELKKRVIQARNYINSLKF